MDTGTPLGGRVVMPRREVTDWRGWRRGGRGGERGHPEGEGERGKGEGKKRAPCPRA